MTARVGAVIAGGRGPIDGVVSGAVRAGIIDGKALGAVVVVVGVMIVLARGVGGRVDGVVADGTAGRCAPGTG
jgi:hypothetical protein